MDNKTLSKYFDVELRTGRCTAKNNIAQKLYQKAIGREAVLDPDTKEILLEARDSNLTALIFLAKVRLGWRETHVVETHEVKAGVQIYLPDNGMKVNSFDPVKEELDE